MGKRNISKATTQTLSLSVVPSKTACLAEPEIKKTPLKEKVLTREKATVAKRGQERRWRRPQGWQQKATIDGGLMDLNLVGGESGTMAGGIERMQYLELAVPDGE